MRTLRLIFFSLKINCNLNWKEQTVLNVVSAPVDNNSTYYTVRSVIPLIGADTLKLVSCVDFHSIMCFRITMWGYVTGSKSVFTTQQKIITKKRIPCRELLNKLNILPLTTAHLFWLLIFVVDNMARFKTNF